MPFVNILARQRMNSNLVVIALEAVPPPPAAAALTTKGSVLRVHPVIRGVFESLHF